MGLALLLFLCLRPARRQRLLRRSLVSRLEREGVLLLFVMFGAGLAALTLFPAHFWASFLAWITDPVGHGNDFDWLAFYPSWDEVMAETDYRNLFTPFQEILRGLRGGPWVFFMLLGNIGMFLPLGFFTALLWRKPRWWKSTLVGTLSSCTIEFVQFFIGRSTDIDDVILNTTGALLGYVLFWFFRLLCPCFAARFQCYERKEVLDGLHD